MPIPWSPSRLTGRGSRDAPSLAHAGPCDPLQPSSAPNARRSRVEPAAPGHRADGHAHAVRGGLGHASARDSVLSFGSAVRCGRRSPTGALAAATGTGDGTNRLRRNADYGARAGDSTRWPEGIASAVRPGGEDAAHREVRSTLARRLPSGRTLPGTGRIVGSAPTVESSGTPPGSTGEMRAVNRRGAVR